MEKKKSANKFIKNYWKVILAVVVIIFVLVLSIIIFNPNKPKEVESKFDAEEVNKDDSIYCQREYLYNGSDTYLISICDEKLLVSKNNSSNKTLNIKKPKYLYSFLTISEYTFYILTENGNLYLLSKDEIINEKYNLEKLDLSNIVDVKEFYKGYTEYDAYTHGIYAIDKNNKMHLLK